MPNQKYQNLAC